MHEASLRSPQKRVHAHSIYPGENKERNYKDKEADFETLSYEKKPIILL